MMFCIDLYVNTIYPLFFSCMIVCGWSEKHNLYHGSWFLSLCFHHMNPSTKYYNQHIPHLIYIWFHAFKSSTDKSLNNWCTALDSIWGIVLESLEIFVEHVCHLVEVDLVLCLIRPGVFGVEDLGVDAVEGLGVLQVENWKGFVFDIGKRAVVDGVDDVSGGFDADTLNKELCTFPYP